MGLNLMFKFLKSFKYKIHSEEKSMLIQALIDCNVVCNQCYYACFREEDVKNAIRVYST